MQIEEVSSGKQSGESEPEEVLEPSKEEEDKDKTEEKSSRSPSLNEAPATQSKAAPPAKAPVQKTPVPKSHFGYRSAGSGAAPPAEKPPRTLRPGEVPRGSSGMEFVQGITIAPGLLMLRRHLEQAFRVNVGGKAMVSLTQQRYSATLTRLCRRGAPAPAEVIGLDAISWVKNRNVELNRRQKAIQEAVDHAVTSIERHCKKRVFVLSLKQHLEEAAAGSTKWRTAKRLYKERMQKLKDSAIRSTIQFRDREFRAMDDEAQNLMDAQTPESDGADGATFLRRLKERRAKPHNKKQAPSGGKVLGIRKALKKQKERKAGGRVATKKEEVEEELPLETEADPAPAQAQAPQTAERRSRKRNPVQQQEKRRKAQIQRRERRRADKEAVLATEATRRVHLLEQKKQGAPPSPCSESSHSSTEERKDEERRGLRLRSRERVRQERQDEEEEEDQWKDIEAADQGASEPSSSWQGQSWRSSWQGRHHGGWARSSWDAGSWSRSAWRSDDARREPGGGRGSAGPSLLEERQARLAAKLRAEGKMDALLFKWLQKPEADDRRRAG